MIDTRHQCYKTFLGIIYAIGGIFPYDFDWGYADSDIITLKKFYMIDTRYQCYKTFLGIIYAISGIFPYDFDWGYADSNVIALKKVLYEWHQTSML